MRKLSRLSWFIAALLVALAAIGCGDKQEQSTQDAAPENVEGGPVESGAAEFSRPNTD